MIALDPADRPKPQLGPLVRALEAHRVDWVMCGSFVLSLHGAKIVPNDLDVVPSLDSDNLVRLACCLEDIGAICAYSEGWPKSLESCRAWTPSPPTAENLDQLMVTPLGLLDIVVSHAAPYAELMAGAARMTAEGVSFHACDPREVLRTLEPRKRTKDRERREVYAQMRRRFGMPDITPPE